jgi:Tfp pilus assembly protein PilO
MTTHVRRILVAAGAVAVILLLAWYFALWSPQSHSLSSAQKAHTAADAKVTSLNTEVIQLQALVHQVPADTAKLATYKADLPDGPALDAALRQIHQMATATGVSVTAVGPSVPAGVAGSSPSGPASQSTAGPPSISLSITGTGSLAQLKAFLTQLATIGGGHRLFAVSHLQYSGTGQLAISMGARIFYAAQPTP